MKQNNWQQTLLSTVFLMLGTFLPISGHAFPIFPAPLAYVNCSTSPGFLGDNSNATNGFAGGMASNVTWDGSKMLLNAGQTSGTFTSRVIDNSCLGVSKPWLNLKWTTTLPFGKEIPATNETTTDYSSKSSSTLNTNLMGLWRFNETSAYSGTANEAVDSSGNGKHATLLSAWGTNNNKVAGLFNNAFNSLDGSPLQVLSANLAQSNVITWSSWIKISSNTVYSQLAMRDNGTNWWRLQLTNTGTVDAGTNTSAGGGYVATSTVITDGNWHHIALTIDGSGNLGLFVDGAKTTGTYNVGTGFTGADLTINSGPVGQVDEAALWHRVLSDAEIVELYRRGANRLKIQVRNCTSATCADNPGWQGPDGTATTWFTELNNNSNQLTGLGTVQAGSATLLFSNFPAVTKTNRYMQYKFTLETDNTTFRPDVKTIGPGR